MMKQQYSRIRRRASRILALAFALTVALSLSVSALAAGGLEMSTSYPGLSVKAGDELDFDLDFSNGSGAGISVALSVVSIPDAWEGYFEGGGSEISHVYVQTGDTRSAAVFHLTVPVNTVQGTYPVTLQAAGGGASSSLTLALSVKEKELGSSAFSAEYDAEL